MNSDITRPRDVDKTDPRYFQVLTRGVEAIIRKDAEGNDRKVIRGIASSSVQDRYGDILTEACQVSMLQQCSGLTMWLNHSYKVPEDILGTQTQATLERATDDAGEDCLDLVIEVTIDEENPRAVKSWQHIQNGTKLAFSIGGFFKDYEIQDDDDYWYIFIVNDIDLIEISLVGIPANPRAYTKALEYATDKLRAEAVKRAESFIAAGTAATRTDARPLVCKSFGLQVEEVTPVEKCAHKDGCDNPHADDSLLCVKHRDDVPIAAPDSMVKTAIETAADGVTREATLGNPGDPPAPEAEIREAEVVNDQLAATRAIEDQAQQSAVIECMRSISKAVTHGLCTESATHASTAHAILTALLPDDVDVPEDAQLAAPPATDMTIRVAVEADTAELQAQLERLQATLATVKGEHEQLSAGVATLSREKAALEQQIAQLKATPTGRSTVSSHSGGSSGGSEPIASAELYNKSQTELMRTAAHKSGSTPTDARATVA